jgi:hypothetical protein
MLLFYPLLTSPEFLLQSHLAQFELLLTKLLHLTVEVCVHLISLRLLLGLFFLHESHLLVELSRLPFLFYETRLHLLFTVLPVELTCLTGLSRLDL